MIGFKHQRIHKNILEDWRITEDNLWHRTGHWSGVAPKLITVVSCKNGKQGVQNILKLGKKWINDSTFSQYQLVLNFWESLKAEQ